MCDHAVRYNATFEYTRAIIINAEDESLTEEDIKRYRDSLQNNTVMECNKLDDKEFEYYNGELSNLVKLLKQ